MHVILCCSDKILPPLLIVFKEIEVTHRWSFLARQNVVNIRTSLNFFKKQKRVATRLGPLFGSKAGFIAEQRVPMTPFFSCPELSKKTSNAHLPDAFSKNEMLVGEWWEIHIFLRNNGSKCIWLTASCTKSALPSCLWEVVFTCATSCPSNCTASCVTVRLRAPMSRQYCNFWLNVG